MKWIVTLCCLCGFLPFTVRAAHLIGGEITYECLDGGNYRFTMKIYRDCAGGGADFDGFGQAPFDATVTFYRGTNDTPFRITSLGRDRIEVRGIDPEEQNPCIFVDPSVCVQEGIYTWTENLPLSPESYHVTYQRCCRNTTINNLIAPGETGATYTIELTPIAQQLCNSSPEFTNLPPVIICVNSALEVDFSATDPDGDQRVYSFCSPRDGGGNIQSAPGNVGPNGVAPNPDTPPPYDPVTFAPTFTTLNPLNGDPLLTINPTTGLITGTPQFTGQYVVGVCVEEYRDGQLLSTVFRDFQFNVTVCEPKVFADLAEDEVVTVGGEELYVINSCGSTVVDFRNQSVDPNFIVSYEWEFDIDGELQGATTRDATFDFEELGTYMGSMVINEGTQCGDTLAIQVNIYPGLYPDFDYSYDTCTAGPVQFEDLSVADAGPNAITDYNWNFGDGNGSDESDPAHTYRVPGDLPVSLTLTDINGCVETYTEVIEYFPVPATLLIAPSSFDGCTPLPVFFDNLSFPIDDSYDIVWDFGDGGTSGAVSPTYTYENGGVYTVSLEVTSPIGCFIDTVFNSLITARQSPEAGFSYTPDQLSNIQPTASFFDESSDDVVFWEWDFGDGRTATQPNPTHTYRDTGQVVVTQTVFAPNGCADTALALIDIIPEVRYFLPNAFTPNFDGDNDTFRGQGILIGARDFHLAIYGRYGERLFETNDPTEGWNGTKDNVGAELPMDVYVVVVQYVEPRGRRVELKGFATLVR